MKPPIAVLLVCRSPIIVCRLPSSTIEELIELGTLVDICIFINLLLCRILVVLTYINIFLSVKPVLSHSTPWAFITSIRKIHALF